MTNKDKYKTTEYNVVTTAYKTYITELSICFYLLLFLTFVFSSGLIFIIFHCFKN